MAWTEESIALVSTMGSIVDSLMALSYRMRLPPSVSKILERCSVELQKQKDVAVDSTEAATPAT